MDGAEEIRDRVLGATAPTRIRARAAWQSRESLVRYELEVDHAAGTWTCHDLTHDLRASFREGVVDHAGEITPSRGYRSRVTMVPLSLVFPERLPVWGRTSDTGIPITTEPLDDDRDLITVRWFADPAMRSTLVFDHHLGMITRFADGLTVTLLDAIETG